MRRVLLHICCPNCATVCIERLREEGFLVCGYFYNPNIQPLSEYKKRKEDLTLLGRQYDIEIIEGDYDADSWWDKTRGYEQEPEGGTRCRLCFEFRLRKAHEYMLSKDIDFFTTTLTISPHKNSRLVNEAGCRVGGKSFLVRNFKKNSGFQDSLKNSRKLNFYRQTYCGCIPSRNEKKRP